jgi:hypothetical protein
MLPARRADVEATPVTSSDTTSGTTVMRIALTHNAPIGSITATAPSETGCWITDRMTPMTRPATRPTRTLEVKDTV